MITSTIKEMIEKNVFVFATVDEQWSPNITPVAYVKVVDKNQLLISDNFMWKTIENIKKHPMISFAFWDSEWTGYKWVWEAEYFTSGKRITEIHKIKENKWLPMKWAIIITVKEIHKIS